MRAPAVRRTPTSPAVFSFLQARTESALVLKLQPHPLPCRLPAAGPGGVLGRPTQGGGAAPLGRPRRAAVPRQPQLRLLLRRLKVRRGRASWLGAARPGSAGVPRPGEFHPALQGLSSPSGLDGKAKPGTPALAGSCHGLWGDQTFVAAHEPAPPGVPSKLLGLGPARQPVLPLGSRFGIASCNWRSRPPFFSCSTRMCSARLTEECRRRLGRMRGFLLAQPRRKGGPDLQHVAELAQDVYALLSQLLATARLPLKGAPGQECPPPLSTVLRAHSGAARFVWLPAPYTHSGRGRACGPRAPVLVWFTAAAPLLPACTWTTMLSAPAPHLTFSNISLSAQTTSPRRTHDRSPCTSA